MTGQVRVPFGLHQDELFEPTQVPNGGACGCVCPACHRPLIAKQNHQTPHFAHAPGEDCAKALETAVHLAAKQLLAERRELRLPVLRYFNPYQRGSSVQDIHMERVIPAESVAMEADLGDMRPDIVVTQGGDTYLVEIAVTHFVDEAKLAKIRARGLPAVEIDVAALKKHFTFAGLTDLLFTTKPYPATWLYHPRQEELAQEAQQAYQAELAAREAAEKAAAEERAAKDAAHAAETAKIRKYQHMAPAQKLALNLRHLGLTQAQLAKFTTFVPFSKTWYCPRAVWQSAVLAYLAHQQAEQDQVVGCRLPALIDPKVCLMWLELRFPVDPANDDEKHAVAFWKYIHFLLALGLLRQDGRDYYLHSPPEIWGQMKVIKPPN